MISRRYLLAATALAPLAACGTNSNGTPMTPQDVVTRAINSAQSLETLITEVRTAYPTVIPDAVYAEVKKDADAAVAAANTFAVSMPVAAGASIIHEVESYLNDALVVLAAPPVNGLIPPPYNALVAAIAFTAPLLEAWADQNLPPTPAVAAAASPKRRALVAGLAVKGGITDQATADALLAKYGARK